MLKGDKFFREVNTHYKQACGHNLTASTPRSLITVIAQIRASQSAMQVVWTCRC
jgi:hypothetical protein